MNQAIRIMMALFAFFLASSTCEAFSASTPTEDSWATKEPIPLGSWSIVGLNGKIYAIAGRGDYGNSSYLNNAVLEYDPASDTWAAKKPMPNRRADTTAAIYQNKIYVIGGPYGENQVYDPANDTWENRTPMPTYRASLEANVVNGEIYLIGGSSGLNEVYNPGNDSWTTKAPMPIGVSGYASAVVDNKIYFIGGSTTERLNITQIYDAGLDTWSFGTPPPVRPDSAVAGATSGVYAPKRIYVIGGLAERSLDGSTTNRVYNPENDSWTIGAPMPTARFQLRMTVLNDQFYVMGGLPYFSLGGAYCFDNEQYTPIGYGIPTPSPQPTEPQPSQSLIVLGVVVALLLALLAIVVLLVYRRKR